MRTKKLSTGANWVDPDDAQELTEAWFAEADLHRGGKLVRRGRPPAAAPKVSTTIRLAPDVLAHFRATGPGWQTRINAALAQWIKAR